MIGITRKMLPDDATDLVVVSRMEKPGFRTLKYLVYFLFDALETLLAFRLILKVTGANTGSSFVGFIYDFSWIFVAPFEGIFPKAVTQGAVATSVFEPSTLIAIVVYAAATQGIITLIRIFSDEKRSF